MNAGVVIRVNAVVVLTLGAALAIPFHSPDSTVTAPGRAYSSLARR
ncbi:MAG TPA: hypothetical protein VNA27_01130 [Rubrobacteraceae bacterium]|nr:hypothetical protein [Rubrobacteraceae bacterium]